VVAADVYAMTPHVGRGGWSWYTGSAGWMYRLLLESLLGVRRDGDTLRLSPCLPADWKEYRLHYRYRETTYHVTVTQTSDGDEEAAVWVDGEPQVDDAVALVDDLVEHTVRVLVRPFPAA
jgi:cellobiose phosphorylase